MSVLPSSEALLVSSLINNHDAGLAELYGVQPSDFVGYGAEYRWVLSFNATYGNAPSTESLLSRFPAFPHSDHRDAAFSADEVRQEASQRSLRAAVRQAVLSVADSDYEAAAMALASFMPLTVARPLQSALLDISFLDAYHESIEALGMPWPSLQHLTGGMRPGDLWYMAARLGQGKSWDAVEIIATQLLAGARIAFYSLEMPKAQMLTRLHVCLGKKLGVEVDHIGMRDRVYDVIAYRKLVNKIRDEVPGQVFMFDASDGRTSPATIAARAGDMDLNVIDYAGLLSSSMGARAVDDWRVMASISNELKFIATNKNTRILALAQVNRDGDSISKYPPKVKNLAQSDALGQDGDVVITHKKYSRSSQIISVEKNRSGASGVHFFTRFLPNEGAFHEISKETADDLRDREEDQE